MVDILASAAHIDDPLGGKSRLGPWLPAWHDPVAGLACNGGCVQVSVVVCTVLVPWSAGCAIYFLYFVRGGVGHQDHAQSVTS